MGVGSYLSGIHGLADGGRVVWWGETTYLDLVGLVPGYPSCDQEVSLISFLPCFSQSSVSSSVFLVSLVLGIQVGGG